MINAFAGLVTISLKNALEDKPRWIQDANISKGTRGGKFPSLWNPVILAIALEEVYFVPKRKLTAAFVNNVSLKEWRQEWTDYVDQYPN